MEGLKESGDRQRETKRQSSLGIDYGDDDEGDYGDYDRDKEREHTERDGDTERERDKER